MKKLITKPRLVAAISLTIFNLGIVNASAWGGYAHWEMGQRISDKYNFIGIERLIFSSGDLLADLGKLSWDIKYTSSDSEEFSNKMLDVASSENSIIFADGWKAHYIQDTGGALSNIEGGPSSYRVKCGWVDEYLRDYKNISSPINNTHEVFVDYDLIRNTYSRLHGFNPSNNQIDKEIKKMYVAFDLQIIANIKGWNNQEKEGIEKELNRTVDLCMNNSYNNLLINDESHKDSLSDDDIKIINETIERYVKKMEISKVIHLDKSKVSAKNEYIVNYIIEDKEEYEKELKVIYNELSNKGIDLSKL
ncbi:hypothetical protein [Faecalimicrobium sp. JNUCC 81]